MTESAYGAALPPGMPDEPATNEVEAAFLQFFSTIEPIAPGLARTATNYVIRGGQGLAEIAEHRAAAKAAFGWRLEHLGAQVANDYVALKSLPAAIRIAELRHIISAPEPSEHETAVQKVDGRLHWFWRAVMFWHDTDGFALPITWSQWVAMHWGLSDAIVIASLYSAPQNWPHKQLRRKKMTNLGQFLFQNPTTVQAVLEDMDGEQLKSLLADAVFFKILKGALLETVFGCAASERVTLAKAARATLIYADKDELHALLKGKLASGSDATRREAAVALSQHVGEKARGTLTAAAKQEKNPAVQVAIDTALGLIAIVEGWNTAKPDAIPDGHTAIAAVDGTWHLIPDAEPLPEDAPLSPGAEAWLRKAFAAFNNAVDAYTQTHGRPPQYRDKIKPEYEDILVQYLSTVSAKKA